MPFVLVLVASVWAADPAALVYAYRGPTGEGDKTAEEIVALVRAAPRAEHLVRGPGAEQWVAWNQVPLLAEAWLTVPPNRPERTEASAPPPPGAGGEPPRNAPPAPADSPVAADPLPAAAPSPEPTSLVRLGGDVRFGFVASNLERLAGQGDAPAAGFVVSRARPVVDVSLGTWLTGRLAIEARQDASTTTYTATEGTFDVRDWADGWSVQGREVWLAATFGEAFRHEVKLGLQEPAFGVRDTYEDRYPFAGEARADLARGLGLIPEEDLGVGWRGTWGERLAVDVQALNGAGGTALDDNAGKDLVARAAFDAGPVSVSASGLYGARAADGTGEQAQGELAVDVHGAHQRVLIEMIAGTTTEDALDTVYSGGAVSAAWDIPLTSPALDHATLVGRATLFDPVWGDAAPDGWWGYGAGGWLAWKVHPGQIVRTGATWQAHLPQNALLPVEHEVVAEAAWQF